MSCGTSDSATAKVIEQQSAGEKPTYYVFWTTANAYGSRGLGMTREAAEDLAAKIRKDGPHAA